MVAWPKVLLLAGVSVRTLAESACRAGIRPVSLDWFADTDTAASSSHCQRVADGKRFAADELLSAAARYAPAGAGAALIYGGGFDAAPYLLYRLMEGRTLLGNTPDTVRRVKSPREFFPVLATLGIPHPETRWTPPQERSEAGSWLMKQASSEGGAGVEWAPVTRPDVGAARARVYFQRRLTGCPCSALFLADGSNARVIGLNALFVSDHRPGHPFLFAGARTLGRLGRRQTSAIRDYVVALTRAFSLRGINSLDFMLDEDNIRVLEINPRPSATLALHDADYPYGLLLHHIEACRGVPTTWRRRAHRWRAFKILYARRAITIPPGVRWPVWCSDRPTAGTSIAHGEPVCSIRTESADAAALEPRLLARERAIRSSLMF